MGLFNRGNKETDEERFERHKREIIDANYLISIELATGTHGADEVVAGAMMGETGKLIAMSKYGNTIWSSTTIQLMNEGFQVHYNGAVIYYENIIGFDRGKHGWSGMEFVIHTTHGDWWFRQERVFAEAVMAVINALKDYYLSKSEEAKIEAEKLAEKEKAESVADRLIHLGEMHERGLLSDEEFDSMKQSLLGKNDENMIDSDEDSSDDNLKDERNPIKFCTGCGAEILEGSNFCIECGKSVK